MMNMEQALMYEKGRLSTIMAAGTRTDLYARNFSTKKRKALAKKGYAMKDGSYPIVTKGDLENAVRAYGRSPDEATKRHIIKRARALGATDMLPADWPGSTKKDDSSK